MYTGRSVFAQLLDVLPRYEFHECVRRYRGNYRMRSFSCLDQFLCMAFAQLTYRESLRKLSRRMRHSRSQFSVQQAALAPPRLRVRRMPSPRRGSARPVRCATPSGAPRARRAL